MKSKKKNNLQQALEFANNVIEDNNLQWPERMTVTKSRFVAFWISMEWPTKNGESQVVSIDWGPHLVRVIGNIESIPTYTPGEHKVAT